MSGVMKSMDVRPEHERLRQSILDVIKREAPDMPANEILAVVSVLVGQLVAHQDQRRFTPGQVMALVARNIEAGNQTVVSQLLKAEGGRA